MPLKNGQSETNLTVDELAVLEQVSRKFARDAVKKEAQRVLHRYIRASIIGFVILLVGLAVAIGIQQRDSDSSRHAIVHSGRVVSVDGCNRDFRTITQLRSILVRSEILVKSQHKKGVYSDAQYADAKTFYDQQLAALTLPDCRVAYTVLTDNPDRLGTPPAPLYVKPKKPKR